MMDLALAMDFLSDKLPKDKVLRPEAKTRALVRGYQRLWRARPWQFAIKRDQINTVENYSTGSVTALTNGLKAVTFSGTSLDNTFIGRFIRIGSEMRDYEITAVGSTTSCTIKDPYEGTTISSSTSYEIVKRRYYLPGDCASILAAKESTSQSWLPIVSRSVFERQAGASKFVSGQAEWMVEAGFSIAAMATAGTVSISGTTVTGTSTAFDSRMEKMEFRVDGYPQSFYVASVTDTTHLELDRPWNGGTITVGTYKIAPAGSAMVELFPAHDANGSIEIWYHRKPPDIAYGHDVPAWYPEYDDLWINCALSTLGLYDEMLLEKQIGDMADRDGIEREAVYQMDGPGNAGSSGGVRPSASSPAQPWYED